jgi:flagellar biosynthesis protein FlhB
MVGPLGLASSVGSVAEDKQFDATTSRLARAKREGDIPTSQSLNVAGSLAASSLVLLGVAPHLATAAQTALSDAVRSGAAATRAYAVLGACAFAVPCGAIGGALLATYLQAGRFSLKFPAPKFEKLHPGEGLKRMFSRDAVVGGAKALTVAAAVSAAIVPAVADAFAAGGGGGVPAELAALVTQALARIVVASLAVAGVFAAIDVLVERGKWKRRLRMSFDELKREHKQSEGDPLLRGRRRQAHRALIRGSIGRIKEAAFVVCNPAHVAVALAYRPPEIPVPQVLVRGIDAGAQEIKRRARELRVPIVENVLLARTLLSATEAGDFIPSDTYAAVAAIVANLVRERVRV